MVGDCWRSYVSMDRMPAEYIVNAVHAITWKMFDDDESNLIGGWTYLGESLAFEQWSTTSELRRLEHSAGFFGHQTRELTDRVMSLADALSGSQAVDWDGFRRAEGFSEDARNQLGKNVISALYDLAPPPSEILKQRSERSDDRRLLWVKPDETLVVAAWFNPAGPTVVALQAFCPDGNEVPCLLYTMRHPILPDYRVVGRLGGVDELRTTLAAGLQLLLEDGASLPTAVGIWGSEESKSAVAPLFYQRVLEVSRVHGIDLQAKADQLASCMGQPWSLAPGAKPPELKTKYLPDICGVADLDAPDLPFTAGSLDPGFARWWSKVARPENYVAHFCDLPDAWDASLNALVQSGAINQFDPGPLILTYTSFATVFRDRNATGEKSPSA